MTKAKRLMKVLLTELLPKIRTKEYFNQVFGPGQFANLRDTNSYATIGNIILDCQNDIEPVRIRLFFERLENMSDEEFDMIVDNDSDDSKSDGREHEDHNWLK